jgi:hypothetical protein
MKMLRRCILLLPILAVATAIGDREFKGKFGTRSFPHKDYENREVANEFQFIDPNNIADGAGEGVYQFLDISPLEISNDEVVTVSYFTTAPSRGDWIAAYSPEDVDIYSTVPVKYGYCDETPGYNVTGEGALRFNLTNLRAGVRFYYFSNGTKYPIYQANSSDVVLFANVNEQLRPRVTATGNPDILQLSWSSNMSALPTLKWGIETNTYLNTVPGVTTRITQDQMCGPPASTYGWRDLGQIHTANFEGMIELANTVVYYMFGDQASNTWSKEYKLFVPPVAGTQPPTRPTTVILYDDMGRGSTDDTCKCTYRLILLCDGSLIHFYICATDTYNEYGRPAVFTAQSVGAEIAAGNVDMVYHGGDISYATGYIAVWDFVSSCSIFVVVQKMLTLYFSRLVFGHVESRRG